MSARSYLIFFSLLSTSILFGRVFFFIKLSICSRGCLTLEVKREFIMRADRVGRSGGGGGSGWLGYLVSSSRHTAGAQRWGRWGGDATAPINKTQLTVTEIITPMIQLYCRVSALSADSLPCEVNLLQQAPPWAPPSHLALLSGSKCARGQA